jgi:hypothetical protein
LPRNRASTCSRGLKYDAELAKADTVTLVVQVNGKVRDRIDAPAGISEDAGARAGAGQPFGAEVV